MTSSPYISRDVVIMTSRELDEIKQAEFQRGVARGKFESLHATQQQRTARNCKNWTRTSDYIGTCQRCGVQWQYMEVGEDFKCPHFEERAP